jgi:glycine/D-amino acid oxidase-like deaminating enzyme
MRTVVIGAGVLGASAAYHLARAGRADDRSVRGRLLAEVSLGRAPALDLAPFDPLQVATPARDVPATLR